MLLGEVQRELVGAARLVTYSEDAAHYRDWIGGSRGLLEYGRVTVDERNTGGGGTVDEWNTVGVR